MADVTISYKGNEIASMSDTGVKTLLTGSTFCEGDISITYTKPGGGASKKKQINFIDYDGTLLYSYAKAEINAMTSESDLPANPSHTGLTAQGWNWTLAQIKAQLTSAPDGDVWVGQMYATESGDTEIDIQLHAPRLSPYLGIAINGTVEVNWGDGTAKSTVTGTSLTTQIRTLHTYADEEPHTISIHKVSGSYTLYGSSTYGILSANSSTTNNNKVYANSVKNVRIGNSVTSIGSNAFYNCYSLVSVTIPSSVTSISSSAFYNCYSLVSVTIPNSVASIANSAFYYCTSLASVTIPNSVKSINGSAFYNCTSLVSVTISSSVTSIGSSAFQNCYSLASVTISSSVTTIPSSAFYNCYSLVSVTIPSSVTSISSSAFYYCYSLASVTISSSVTTIQSSAFYYCNSLASVTIPNSVTSIANNAFYYCTGLGSIHFKSSTPPTVSNSNAWSGVPTDCIIYVPSGKKSNYTSASNYPSSSTYTYVEE